MRQELESQESEKELLKTNEELLKAGYSLQLFPRPINLFYLTDESRDRIVFNSDTNKFSMDNQNGKAWSKKDILDELETFPDRFSPNAVLRPIYQETILPNLVYIGGWGEINYWMQLKNVFIIKIVLCGHIWK